MEGRTQVTQSSNVKPFSAGLRVLVVDHDPTYLKNVVGMLRACRYRVVAVNHAVEALAIVRERRGGFDIIIVEQHIPVEDGLHLLMCIRREFKLPAIVICADDKKEAAEKYLDAGASFCYTEPLSMRNIEDLWQYVFLHKREKMKSVPEMKGKKRVLEESSSMAKASASTFPLRPKASASTFPFGMKQRVYWTEKLHLKFLQAIEILGPKNAIPSKILVVMNEPGLCRDHIASHLQKYRNYVRGHRQYMEFDHPTSSQPSFENNNGEGFSSNLEQQCLNIGVQQNLSIEKLLPTNSVRELNQSFPSAKSHFNPRNDFSYSTCQKKPCGISMNSYGDDPMIQIYNRCNSKTPHGNNIEQVQCIGSMGLVNEFNQASNFNSTGNDCVGFQFTDFGIEFGLDQATISIGPSNDTNYGYNSTHEQEVPVPPPLEQEQNGFGVGEDEFYNQVDFFKDVSMSGDASFLQPFNEDDLHNTLDHFSDQ